MLQQGLRFTVGWLIGGPKQSGSLLDISILSLSKRTKVSKKHVVCMTVYGVLTGSCLNLLGGIEAPAERGDFGDLARCS